MDLIRTGGVNLKALLEGNSSIRCSNLEAKIINGDDVCIEAESSSLAVEAMYVRSTEIVSSNRRGQWQRMWRERGDRSDERKRKSQH